MSDNASELGGEVLGGALFDEALHRPIDPDSPVEEAAKKISTLCLAAPERKNISSGVVAQVFAAIQKLDRPGANADELNNVGCAWALLAYKESRLEYWPRATAALKDSRDYKDASDEQKKRAEENLERIVAARKATESP